MNSKEVHGLLAKKAKLEMPLTCKRSPWHQGHVEINVRILKDAIAVWRQNHQKVASCAHAKTQHKWDKLVIVTKQCPPLPKPTLVKLTFKQLL